MRSILSAGSPRFWGMDNAVAELTETELEILAFEQHWWKYPGAKESAVRDRFDMSPTRYFQVLNALIDRPEALAADAPLVHRLQRLRAARRRQRSSTRVA